MTDRGQSYALMVLERGSRLPSRFCRDERPRVVISQRRAESHVALVQRTLERVTELEQSGAHVSGAMMVCTETEHPGAAFARATLAGVLVDSLKGSRSAELFVAMSGASSPSLRAHLVTLAGSALSRMGSMGGSVHVWLSDEAQLAR
jgi:hypothetical protein